MTTFPLATPDGLGAGYAAGLSRRRAALGALGGVGIAAVATGWWVGPLAAAGVVAAVAVGALAVRKIGGVTGDVLGAIEQVSECLVLVVVTALAPATPCGGAPDPPTPELSASSELLLPMKQTNERMGAVRTRRRRRRRRRRIGPRPTHSRSRDPAASAPSSPWTRRPPKFRFEAVGSGPARHGYTVMNPGAVVLVAVTLT